MEAGPGAGDDIPRRGARPARARTAAVPGVAGAGARSGAVIQPDRWAQAVGTRLAADFAREAEAGRLVLWLPAAFAAGILLYFGAAQEPALPAVALLTLALAIGTGLARRHAIALGVLLVLVAIAGGFLAGCVRTALVTHDVVVPPPFPVRLAGYVEQVERRAGSDRIVLRVDPGAVRGLAVTPERVRLSLRRGWAPPVGAHVTQLARLLPPSAPALPGGHDFGRGPWFRRIGAMGFGLGRPATTVGAPAPPPWSVRFAVAVDAARAMLAERIRAVLKGTAAEIAIALVAGDRSAIAAEVEESMRVSGLTHILSISGLHMALVAGTLFAVVRGGLALLPALALGWPIKSMAAVVALVGSAGYLVLSGNDVPAQRSFVMTALVLAGVMVGRPALTLRTVAVAAVVVLMFRPEAALEPGTQMSFAATLALVAAYERLRPLRAFPRPDALPARLLVFPLLFLGGVALTSFIAGLASGPFGAFHFQRVAPYGLIANLAAMPAVSLLVMPFGLLGVLLIPFGWDALAWPVMGIGIDIMVAVSDRIAALPGADVRITWISAACLGWLSLAVLWLCLFRGALALLAAAPLAAALVAAGPPPRPDILVAPDAALVAVRQPDGRLALLGGRSHRLMAEQWLIREGDRRPAGDPALAAAFRCEDEGCVAQLPGGGTLAVSRSRDGLEADCLHARIVVTPHPPPAGCPARVFSADRLERSGTLAFYRDGAAADAAGAGAAGGWRIEATRPAGVDRPWMPRLKPLPPQDGDDRWPDEDAGYEAQRD